MSATLLTPADLAGRWSTTPASLAQMRHKQRGPSYRKIGSRVLYVLAEVEEYEESNAVRIPGAAA